MVVQKVYAQAIFELAQENNQLDSVFSKLKFALDNIFSDCRFISFLLNPNINFEQKKSVLEKIFPDIDDKLVLDFFLLLLRKNRFIFYSSIIVSFFNMYYDYKNILHAQIISESVLPENILTDIKNVLEKKFSAGIITQNIIDENIIGGFIIKIRETVIDSSVKFKLDCFKKFLLQLNLNEWGAFSA